MNKHVKRKWLKALRSGKYRKGVGLLKHLGNSEIEYCCLGVLAEECFPELLKAAEYDYRISGDGGFIPDDLAVMVSLEFEAQEELADLNDDSSSFEPAINYIERNL